MRGLFNRIKANLMASLPKTKHSASGTFINGGFSNFHSENSYEILCNEELIGVRVSRHFCGNTHNMGRSGGEERLTARDRTPCRAASDPTICSKRL